MGKIHQRHLRTGRVPAKTNVTPMVTHGNSVLQQGPTGNMPEQVTVALQKIAVDARAGLLAFAVGVGLEVFHTLLEENVSELAQAEGAAPSGAAGLPPRARAIEPHLGWAQGHCGQAAGALLPGRGGGGAALEGVQ